MIGLYLHIPYCRTLCPYCDFVRQQTGGQVPDSFIAALCSEIGRFQGPDDVDTVFFGGGTPSLIAPDSLELVINAINSRFRLVDDPEITIEANPDDLTPGLANAWKALGINRVSLGVQSFDDHVLAYLGRRHDAGRARHACGAVAERFDNWSMDLIFGGGPVEAWEQTLRECAAISPPHVSAYGLTYEPGTPFARREIDAMDDDTALDCYRMPREMLSRHERYEISNHALPGFQCRHNLRYWHNDEYAGFGPGAYSFVDGVRARNDIDTPAYLASPGHKVEELRLADDEIRVETLIQHFRLASGLPKGYYEQRFGRNLNQDYGAKLGTLISRGLLEDHDGVIRPTTQGFELNNEIGLLLVD